jgi:hypothetical protein
MKILIKLMCYVNKEHAMETDTKGQTPQLIHTSHAQYWQQRKSQTQAWKEDAVH